MSILQHPETNDRRAKKRKLSHPANGEARFEQVLSDASEEDVSDLEQKNPVKCGRPVRKQMMQRAASKAALPSGGLNRLSILTVQLNELIAESMPDYDAQISDITPSLERIQQLIQQVPSTGPLSLKHAENLISSEGATIPFPSTAPSKDTNLKFEYDRPTSLEPQSALHMKLAISGPEVVKVVVEMPKHLFQEKDYLNHRAFHKRVFYLARMAAFINTEAGEEFELHYAHDDGVELLPGITLTPRTSPAADKKRRKPQYRFFVTISFPEGVFDIEKTHPNRNCVRAKAGSDTSDLKPTPVYNSILNSQSTIRHYQDLVQQATQRCSSFADACRAGQIWLRQRGFSSAVASGGFGMWEWATISALLLQTGGHNGHPLFSDRYNSLQLFKAMLQLLSAKDLTESWVLNANHVALPKSDTPTLYDGKTGVNVLQKMTPWSYQSLRHHAQVSLASVNSKQEDNFAATFDLRVADPRLQYDEIYAIPTSALESIASEGQHAVLLKLYPVLKRGLRDRVTLLGLQASPPKPWAVTNSQRSLKRDDTTLELRLLLNMDTTSRLIDHGPSAEDQDAAAEFQRFWGEKSELRRFKDGSISESVVWSSSEPVTLQIIRHLLDRHFKAPEASLAFKSPRVGEDLLEADSTVNSNEAYKLVSNQFQSLSSTLHQLEGLPLPIRSISPTGSALRSSTINHPLLPNSAAPIPVVIQFDSSPRWPDSLPAIQHTKIAFLLKVADLLSNANSAMTTRLGLENTSSQHSGYLNTSYLDVIYPPPHPQLSHITFRLRIQHDRELLLLQSQLTKSLSPKERTHLTSALTAHKRTLASPLHTTSLRTLTTRFPPLSPTIRLLKAFFSAQHLSNLLPAETLELIAAHIFLHPTPWSAPASPSTAFLRCLHFLARWDWHVTPLIVDLSLSQDMSDQAREELKTRFAAWRRLDPQMNSVAWFVGTSIDGAGVVWTEGGRVEKVVAGRVRALAGAAMELVRSKGSSMQKEEWQGLFVGETGEFDFVIRLKKGLVRSVGHLQGRRAKQEKQEKKFKNLELAQQTLSTDEVGFDPVTLYLSDLEKAFGHVALLFHGEGQAVICGLWRPRVTGEKDWRVRLGWSSVPLRAKDDDQAEGDGTKVLCTINKEAVLTEMGMLGEGIVREITSSPRQ